MKLTLDHIQAKGLKDTSSFVDIQDPVIHINIGKVFLNTEKKNNCRTEANFDAVLSADITEENYNANVLLEIEAFNEGTWGTKHIGKGSVGLKSVLTETNQHVSFVIPLKHHDKNGKSKDGKPHGEVVIRAYLEGPNKLNKPDPSSSDPAIQSEAPVKPSQPPSQNEFTITTPPPSTLPQKGEYDETQPARLRLEALQARGLKNKGGAMDKQDPSLRITVGDFKPFNTERAKDAGVDANFPEVFELDIPMNKLTSNLAMEVEAFNVGGAPFYGRTSLGKVRVALTSAIAAFNKPTPIALDLIYDSQKTGPTKFGQVLMLGSLVRPLKAASSRPSHIEAPSTTVAEKPKSTERSEAAIVEPIQASGAAVAATGGVNASPAEPAPVSGVPLVAVSPDAVTNTSISTAPTHYLFVAEVTASDLKAVELVATDKNDPFALLSFGKWSQQTAPIPEAGSHASWRYNKDEPAGRVMRFAVSQEELESGSFSVTVKDKNSFLKDKLIGSGTAHLPKKLVPGSGVTQTEAVRDEVVIELRGKDGKKSGALSLVLERETVLPASSKPVSVPTVPLSAVEEGVAKASAPAVEISASAPTEQSSRMGPAEVDFSSFKHTLFVSKVRGIGLKNVEKMFLDKNDPYIQLKFGRNTWSCKTSVLEEAGGDPVWQFDQHKDPQMKFAVSLEELQDRAAGLLRVAAYDKNKLLSDVHIGEGEAALCTAGPELVPSVAAEERVTAVVALDIRDSAGKASGAVEVTIERTTMSKERKPVTNVEEKPKADASAEGGGKTTKPFETGALLVTRIVCQDLPNVERAGGKNDVFVVLQLGAEERKTECIAEGGANVCFDYLNFSFDVDRGLVEFEPLQVSVFDDNTFTSKTLIGKSSSSVRYMLQKQDEDGVQLPLILKNDKGREAGKVILFLTLKPAELNAAPEQPLDPRFLGGLLRINRVRAFDLAKPKSLLGSSHVAHPYVKMAFGSWQYKTPALSVAVSGSPIFDHLDLAAEVTAAMLQSTKLQVEVYEKGAISDTLVGSGECSMRETGVKIGEERQIAVDLVNKGATAGKLVIFACAVEKKPKTHKSEVKLDDAFVQGYLQVKAVTAHNLKNTELLNGKQDPYIVLEFKPTGWKERTATQADAGSDAHWKDLDLCCGNLTKPLLLQDQDLMVTAFDDNTARPDAWIGSAAVQLVEAAAQGVLGEDVELEADLLDKAGAPAGRIVLRCSLHPAVTEVKLPPDLPDGVVKIRKIIARGLETGNRLTKNAPSVHLQYGAWEGTTAVGEGTDPVWDYLALETAPSVGAELLSRQPLVLSLLDNKKKIGEGTIENLLLLGAQAGADVDVPVQLSHTKSGASIGRLALTMSFGEPTVSVAALIAQEEELPLPSFTSAVLLIHSIKAEGLASVDLFDKSDPFVTLALGGWSEQTNACENAGGNAIWSGLKLREEFSVDELVHQQMEVAVYDKNQYRKNVLLGRGQLSLKRAAHSVGSEVELFVQLTDAKGAKNAGRLFMTAELREPCQDQTKALPADFREALLHVFRVSAFNLPNKELIGKQDPFVVLKLGDFQDRTPTMSEAGSDPVFESLDIKTRVTAPILENQQLLLEAWEDNTTGNILLGTGTVELKKFSAVGEDVQLRVKLLDAQGRNAGRLLVCARLEDMPPSEEEVAAVPLSEGFTRGSIHVRKVCAFGLANTDLFLTKQDPYVLLKLADWTAQTKVKDNAGTDCVWDELDLETDVDVDTLQTLAFEVKVMNKNNLRSHAEIGAGSVALRRAGTQVGQLVELSVNLLAPNGGKPAGRVVLHVQILPEESVGSYALPVDFAFGHFKVNKISAFNLKNTELHGLQDPYIKLKLGEWEAQTYTQDEAGSDATWNFLAIGCDLVREALTGQMLEVAAFDENKGRAHALIGTGAVSLLKSAAHLGEEVELKVKLVDSQGKPSGRVTIFGALSLPEPEGELPESFVEGMLQIKRLSAFSLKNSEMLGLKKGDPYMHLRLNDFQADTKVLRGAGENPVWKSLDFEALCDVKTVRVGELVVEAWENNNAFGDKLLASCEIPIKRSGGKLGQEVELIGHLKTAKGERRGEVNVLVQLNPLATLSLPELGLPEGFAVGTVRITKIQALGLQNKEVLGGKQDPYVCVTLGDWNETTDTLSSAGSAATWTALDMLCEVNTEMLARERLTVRVIDENTTRRDSVLGVGEVSLRKLCSRLNSAVELGVDLVAENGAAVGRIVLTAMLSQSRLDDMVDALPESAVVVTRGQLVVKKISAFDLRGGDSAFFGDKQDPYVELSMENDWTSKTDFKPNAGRSAVWTDIADMELPVTGDTLKYKTITVTVLDKNNLGKDTWMGKGSFSLRKLGSTQLGCVVSHAVRLKDRRGRAAGKVVVDAEIQPLADIAQVAASTGNLQDMGVLSIMECAVSKVAETALVGKQDLHVKLAVADWSGTSEVNKSAGTSSAWSLRMNTRRLAVAQLLQSGGLKVEVVGHSMKGDSVLGRASVSLEKSVAQPGRWVDLVADLIGGAGSTTSVGKVRLKVRFGLGSDTDLSFPVPSAGDQGISDLKTSQNALNTRVGAMEESIKEQLHKELAAERDSILEAMSKQNKVLAHSIESLSKELAKERHAKTSVLDGLVVSRVNSLKLPADVKQWRCAHVQAWISFQMELPQYAEAFQKASIDGLVLVRHINRDTLQNAMEITDPLHCQKILEGVRILSDKQNRIDAQAERERIQKLQAKKEEEERKRAAMAELQMQSEKKLKKSEKTKKKKQVSKVQRKTYFGEVREQNEVDRARLEREVRLRHAEDRKRQEQAESASRTWKFEYTGAPQPKAADTIWDSDPFSKTTGSSAYRRTMALGVLTSEQFHGDNAMPSAPSASKVRNVPRNCSPEEVLALVKGAMFDVSEWLLEVDKIERRRRAAQDSDLTDANDEQFLTFLLARDEAEMGAYNSDDEPDSHYPGLEDFSAVDSESLPPAYEDVVDADQAQSSVTDYRGEYADDDMEEPPPAYEEVVEDSSTAHSNRRHKLLPPPSPSPPNSKLLSFIQTGAGDPVQHEGQREPDRMTLIFRALVGQHNNNARWLGSNTKLTRMKLYGGFESLLRLRIEWTQFDALWTQLDHKRSGDIDLQEFSAFFGDLAEFKSLMGTQALSTTAPSKSVSQLTKCLYLLCDQLRRAGFTVVEMFSAFDRNGSGEVSISEFCSMLRLVAGNQFEKRLIYQALSVLDANGDKAISLEELLRFVYRVWKSQLDELAHKLSLLDEHMTGEAEKIQKLLEERRLIKEAIKRNFPREWRDRLEREGSLSVPGPFQALLQRMDIGHTTASTSGGSPVKDLQQAAPSSPPLQHRRYRPSETWTAPPSSHSGGESDPHALFTASAPRALRPTSSTGTAAKMTSRQLSAAGQSEVMRFKIKMPAGCAPTRTGADLRVPHVRDLNATPMHSAEATDSMLRKSAPFDGYS